MLMKKNYLKHVGNVTDARFQSVRPEVYIMDIYSKLQGVNEILRNVETYRLRLSISFSFLLWIF